jgi:hypothetical protein
MFFVTAPYFHCIYITILHLRFSHAVNILAVLIFFIWETLSAVIKVVLDFPIVVTSINVIFSGFLLYIKNVIKYFLKKAVPLAEEL